MLFKYVKSDQEEKEGDLLNLNCIIILNSLVTNTYNFLFCKECAQDRDIHIELERGKDQEKIVAYVEAYFQLTPTYE